VDLTGSNDLNSHWQPSDMAQQRGRRDNAM
jgi:hypothetical protein